MQGHLFPENTALERSGLVYQAQTGVEQHNRIIRAWSKNLELAVELLSIRRYTIASKVK